MSMLELRGIRLVIHLPVELDHHYTEELRRQIDEIVQEKPISELEFDFSQTMFMDSAGIGMIIGRYKLMQALDGRLIVSHMSGQIRRVLSLSGIQKCIRLDKEEAI
ncbi:MAG: anti-sigma factor antagonist [Clostridiales bacterium]|nr:anti-sigma factor antagonist [Clostridiales bacterium]